MDNFEKKSTPDWFVSADMDRKDDLINISLFLSETISHSDLDFYRFLYYDK